MAAQTRVSKTGKSQELVEILVNGKNGQHVSHRWRNVKGGKDTPNDPLKTTKKKIRGIAQDNALKLLQIFSAEMVKEIARDTPVKTGRATANWKVGLNKQPRPNSDTDKTASASPTVKKAEKVLKDLKSSDTVYIKNSVKSDKEGGYIIKLEHGGSRQAPTGMFRKNVANWKRIAKRAEKKIGL